MLATRRSDASDKPPCGTVVYIDGKVGRCQHTGLAANSIVYPLLVNTKYWLCRALFVFKVDQGVYFTLSNWPRSKVVKQQE